MAFDYDKIKEQEEGGAHWATYSDLFMVLSLVFLLLYVVSSLRTGTMGIQQHIEHQQIARQNADLQEQIRVYNTLKDDYLKTGSSEEEMETYKNLMDKLSLLQEESNQEKKRLSKEAQELAQKEEALNEYQQLVRNIVNSNLISQARMKQRERIIDKKDVIIDVKESEVAELQKTVEQKEAAIEASEAEMEKVSKQLDQRVKQLQQAFKKQKISKAKMNSQIAKLKQENQEKMQELQSKSESLSQELNNMNAELAEAAKELNQAQSTIKAQGSAIADLVNQTNTYSEQMKNLQSNYEQERKKEREAFEKQMSQQKLSAAARAKQEAQFRKQAQEKEQQLASKLGDLQGRVQESQAALDQAMAAKIEAEKNAKGLAKEAEGLSKDLAKMKAIANAKAKLTNDIKKSLAKAGVKAEVDGKTGDVILSFGEEYFDTGQAALKPAMKDVLERFMPIYSEKLLSDPSLAKKVQSVEIIGFASPTYKGKFVDPVSLEASDREAVNYNLDLSYYRARSIFDHIFDTSKMQYKYQQDLLPKVKVTGRSFLAAEGERDLASQLSVKEYCAKHNCEQSQKVIIRFDLKP